MKLRLGAALLTFLAAASGYAAEPTPWEVAVIFSGADEPGQYHQDVDQNILELARVIPGKNLHISIYRELPEHAVEYFVDPDSSRLNRWDPLFFRAPVAGIE